MKVGLPALRAAAPGGAVLRPGFHRPAALLWARPLRLRRNRWARRESEKVLRHERRGGFFGSQGPAHFPFPPQLGQSSHPVWLTE